MKDERAIRAAEKISDAAIAAYTDYVSDDEAASIIADEYADVLAENEQLRKRVAELEKPPEQWTVSDRRDGYIIGICPMCEATLIIGE